MDIKIRHYRSDGNIPATAFVYLMLVTVMVFLLATVQAWSNKSLSPSLWPVIGLLHLVAWLFLGRWFIRKAHIRNPPFLTVITLGLSILDYWCLAAIESGHLLPERFVSLLALDIEKMPADLVLSEQISMGATLAVIRLAEWFVMVAIVGWALFRYYRSLVYCSNCSEWTSAEESVLAFYQLDEPEFERHITAANLEFLDDAEPILTEPFQDYYQINVSLCEVCNDYFAVSVYKYHKPSDIDKGKPHRIINKLIISRAAYQHLLFEKTKYPVPDCSRLGD